MNLRKINIVIDHSGPTVPFDAFVKIVRTTVSLLRGVDRKLTEEPSLSADWHISEASMRSPLHLTLTATPMNEDVQPRDIVAPFLRDMNHLERGEPPEYFTPRLQGLARELVGVLGNRIQAVHFSSDGMEACPTQRVAASVNELESPYYDMGSIEGYLDVISVHGQDEVRVWDTRYNCQVECHISDSQVEDAKELLGKRVSIGGHIRHVRSRPVSIMDVFDIRRLDDPAGPPQCEDIVPIVLTGNKEPEDYLRGDD